jgi:uncharacterized protein YjdB
VREQPSVPIAARRILAVAALMLGLAAGCTGRSDLLPPLQSLAVKPGVGSMNAGTTTQLQATGVYGDGRTEDLTANAAWRSSNPDVAAIDAASGLVTAVAAGTTTVTATLHGVSGTATLTVVRPTTLSSIAVSPAAPSIPVGTLTQLAATATDSDGSMYDVSPVVAWSSSADATATVTGGRVAGVAPGTVTITATLGGKSATATVVVVPLALTSIAIDPPNPTVGKGSVVSFHATGTYNDASTQDLTAIVTWSSSNTGAATISNNAASAGQATTAVPGTTTITAVAGGQSATATLTVTAATLTSLAVTPPSPSLAPGTRQLFAASGTYSDGTHQDVTAAVTWSSSNAAAAAVSDAAGSKGLATAVAAGTTTISAALGGVAASASLTVTSATLTAIAVDPANPTIAKGTGQTFTATGIFSDGTNQDLSALVTWQSDAPGVATVSNAGASPGQAAGADVGTATITASFLGVDGSTLLTVSPAQLVSLGITPAAPSIALGTSAQLTATGVFTDGTQQVLTATASWDSSDPAVATVSTGAATPRLAQSVSVGTTTITATFGGKSTTTVLTVTSAAVLAIQVSPATGSIPKGTHQALTATGTFTDNSTQNITALVTWASSDTSVATVSNAAGSAGRATGAGVGTAHITASLGGVTGTADLDVTAATLLGLSVMPSAPTIPVGARQQLAAIGSYSDGSTQNLTAQATWGSSDPSVATVSSAAATAGSVTAVAVGQADIQVTCGGQTATAHLVITPAAVVSMVITPANATMTKGATKAFSVVGTFTDGSMQTLTTQATWTSSDQSRVLISNAAGSQGLATAVKKTSAGGITISAAFGGKTASTTLTVTGPTPVSLAVIVMGGSPSSVVQMPNGTSREFVAVVTYSDGSTVGMQAIPWSSTDPSVAIVSNAMGTQGLVSAVMPGTTQLVATYAGLTGQIDLIILP